MSDADEHPIRPSALADAGRPLGSRIAEMAERLADLVSRVTPGEAADDRRRFLSNIAEQLDPAASGRTGEVPRDSATPLLIRLTDAFEWSARDLDLLVLAGLPEEHEGFCHVLRSLHPRGEPRPTVALATRLLTSTPAERAAMTESLARGPLVRSGALRPGADGPAPERSLVTAEGLWALLRGADVWPSSLEPLPRTVLPGIADTWLQRTEAEQARTLLAANARVTLLVLADDEDLALDWGLALAQSAHLTACAFSWPLVASREQQELLAVHTIARGVLPVLRVRPADDHQSEPVLMLADMPGPSIVCARLGIAPVRGNRPVHPLLVARLRPVERRHMWTLALPELENEAEALATRYAVEPYLAQEVATDVRVWAKVSKKPVLADVAESVRVRSAVPIASGVALVRPSATWDHLVLKQPRLQQLKEAVSRLEGQAQVLDQWKFLEGRPGARGVRMLFVGPPGTGKTLSAEVLASALGVDLLVADVSRLVSKWIGDTPKNLGRVFDLAERSTAVILFDEADALFGKRTEVTDAHDRYANLETAYLLSRLERFEGLAILASNLRQNIDTAFLRRLEFIVDFDEPAAAERERLWACHVPSRKLLAGDVSFAELAAAYPVTGALIRNAAVAAAFLAASEKTRITRRHLTHAMRREYEKSGRAFPGDLPGITREDPHELRGRHG